MCLFCFYNSANATISPPAGPGYHQLLLGNQVDILGSPLGNHLPIKFGKPCIYVDFNIRDVNIEFSRMNFVSHHDYIINHWNGFNFRARGNSNGCNSVTRNADNLIPLNITVLDI